MHIHATAVADRQEVGPVSPVIAGGAWLADDDLDQPLTLQLWLPVSAEELATALYHDHQLRPADLAADESVWGFAAVAIVQDGLNAIQRHADEILLAEAHGTLADPARLAMCRRRVAEVTGSAPASPAAASTSTAVTARAGAQPPSTTTYQRPRAPHEETTPAEPRTRAEGLASVPALTETVSPCHAGN
jgi:hypothetical protein